MSRLTTGFNGRLIRAIGAALAGRVGSRYLWIYLVLYSVVPLYRYHWSYGYCFDPENARGEELGFGRFYDFFAAKRIWPDSLPGELERMLVLSYIFVVFLVFAGSFLSKNNKMLSMLTRTCLLLTMFWLDRYANYISALYSCRLAFAHKNIMSYYDDVKAGIGGAAHLIELRSSSAGAVWSAIVFPVWSSAGVAVNGCSAVLLQDPAKFVATHGGVPGGWIHAINLSAFPKFDAPTDTYWTNPRVSGFFNVRGRQINGIPYYTILLCMSEPEPQGG
jgi:hypothetical protein